jgi:hypothetical protein
MHLIILCLAAALALIAHSAAAEPLKLTVGEAVDLIDALRGLDGYPEMVSEDGKSRIIKRPFVLDGPVRMAITQDIIALTPFERAYQRAHDDKLCELSAGACRIADGTPAAKTLLDYDAENKQAPAAVELAPLSVEQLKLDKNAALGPAILVPLAPLLGTAK